MRYDLSSFVQKQKETHNNFKKVAIFPPLVVQHFLWNKVTVRDKLFEHLKIPRITLCTDGSNKWKDLAEDAVKRLSEKHDLKVEDLRENGLVSKLDYSEGSKDVYFLKYLNSHW